MRLGSAGGLSRLATRGRPLASLPAVSRLRDLNRRAFPAENPPAGQGCRRCSTNACPITFRSVVKQSREHDNKYRAKISGGPFSASFSQRKTLNIRQKRGFATPFSGFAQAP